jgi:hypothetical protein
VISDGCPLIERMFGAGADIFNELSNDTSEIEGNLLVVDRALEASLRCDMPRQPVVIEIDQKVQEVLARQWKDKG